jgi:hypothetical protein
MFFIYHADEKAKKGSSFLEIRRNADLEPITGAPLRRLPAVPPVLKTEFGVIRLEPQERGYAAAIGTIRTSVTCV